MIPILAVDVDGVLRALGGDPVPDGWRETEITPEGWRNISHLPLFVRYNPAHGAKLLAVAQETGAELTWCTSWEELANKYIAPLAGLPQLPVVPLAPGWANLKFYQARNQAAGVTKARAMVAYAGERPVCWLDDDPDVTETLRSWQVPHLVIEVPERTGLQDEHLERAHAWLREHVQPAGGACG